MVAAQVKLTFVIVAPPQEVYAKAQTALTARLYAFSRRGCPVCKTVPSFGHGENRVVKNVIIQHAPDGVVREFTLDVGWNIVIDIDHCERHEVRVFDAGNIDLIRTVTALKQR